jgi:type IV pilus assembly protein PilC
MTMNLTYDAIDTQGQMVHDTIEAANQREAVDQLRRKGLYVTQIRDGQKATARSAPTPARPHGIRLPLKVLVQSTRQLAMLLRSGSGLVPAMRAIRRQMVKPHHAALFDSVIEDLEDGAPLSETLRKHPRTFDVVYCAIIAAGEASGTLPEMFDRLTHIVANRRAMHKKITGALAYPALLIFMCSSIIKIMLLFVLPRFGDMFEQLGVEVPATTQIMLDAGAIMRGYWPLMLGAVAFAAAGVCLWVTRGGGQQWLCDIQTRLPFFGKLRSYLIQGQIFRTMGMLLESGVGVLDTLELVRGSTRNKDFQELFTNLDEAVTSGGRLSTAFEQSRVVPIHICQAIHTGEESGNLGGAFSFCADNLDEDNEELVKVITRLIEPIILMGMGLVVGIVALSLFMPLFDMTSSMR